MRSRLVAAVVGSAVAAFAGAAGYVRAQALDSNPTRLPVTVQLAARVYGEFADGQSPGGASVFAELTSSEFRKVWLRGSDATCHLTGGTGVPKNKPDDKPHDVQWEIEARLVGATEDNATLDLRWKRILTVAGSVFGGDQPLEESRRINLDHGEWLPLDIVRASNAQENDCQRLMVGLTFQVKPEPEVAEAALRYDLWLIHREADGRTATERLQSSGEQDGTVNYVFAMMHHDSQGVPAEQPTDATLETEISGTLRGRARPDGLIDVTLRTSRKVYESGARRRDGLWRKEAWIEDGVFRERDSRGMVGSGGLKGVTVRPSETIEIPLPPASGRLRQGELSELFAGQSTAIRITTTRIR